MFTKVKSSVVKGAAALAAALAPAAALAQNPTASQLLSTAQGEIKGISSTFINVVTIIIGLIGVTFLAINGVKYYKGDPSSSGALIKVGVGLVIIAILIQIIKLGFGL